MSAKQTTSKKAGKVCAGCQAEFKSKDPEMHLCPRCRKPKKPGTGNGSAPVPTPATEPVVNVQDLVNEMVWQHGVNLAHRGDYPDLLAGAGLKPAQVSKKVLSKAIKAFHQRVKDETEKPQPDQGQRLAWKVEPQEETWTSARVHYWESECGRYRAYRIDSEARERVDYGAQFRAGEGRWDACECDSKQGAGYPKYAKTLEAALLVVEKFHLERYKLETVTTNRDEVLSRAKELGLVVTPVVTSNGSATPKTRAPRAPRAAGEGVDEFGNRVGSQASQINAVLGTEPLSIKELAERAKLTTSRVQGHLKWLQAKNFVVHSDKGYARKPQ